MDSFAVLVQGAAGLVGRAELLLPLVVQVGGAGLARLAGLAARLGLRRGAGLARGEELLQVLGAPPGRAAIDSAGADEQAEDDGPEGHGDERTGGGRIP